MAVTTYTVKRGDCLSRICERFSDSIPVNGLWNKVAYVAELNNIDPDVIHTGQVLKLNEGSSTAGTSTAPVTPQQVTIKGFGIPQVYHELDGSVTDDGRSVFVQWTWTRDNTDSFSIHWTEYIGGTIVRVHDDTISIPENTPNDILYEYCRHTLSAQNTTTKVRFRILPVARTHKVKNEDVPYWKEGTGADDVKWSDTKEYDFSNNPPKPPGTPTIEIEDRTLTMFIDNIKASELDAKYVKFNIVKNNTSSIHTSPPVTINTETNYVSYQYEVPYGATYRVRACSVGTDGKKESSWSDFSANVGTKPSAPSEITVYRRNKRSDGSISAYLEWTAVTNADSYVVEYTTVLEDFETAEQNLQKTETIDARTSLEITGIESGHDYFFRVRASNENGTSDPTGIVTIPIGEPPAAPTTWSSANSAFVGESMELSWIHNARDGSAQSYAELGLKINDDDWVSFVFENATNTTTGEQVVETTFSYGKAISYKGDLYVKMDTTHALLADAKIQWKVRTAGVTDAFSDTDWSIVRTIYIYEKPTLALAVTGDLAGDDIVETLTALPLYIRAEVELDSYEIQKPIGYHLRVVSNDFYETIDDTGRTKTINPGDAVYSKYFDTEETLIVELSADSIDLESGINYTVYCAVDMSTGLSVEQTHDFDVEWVDVTYTLSANINVDPAAYTVSINPYCMDTDGNLIDNVTLAVYRREYNGSLTKIASGIPNNGTFVTDPHPALDYARYRLIAKDINTGAISFYDMPGHKIGCKSVVIQWDEEWSRFEVTDINSVEGPPWSGSMLVLPYNVSITDNRKREVSLVTYAGREYPVTYYGTSISESSSWSTEIPKSDVETIYALRRLSLWTGNVYVREPSGMGFWATVNAKFNVNYNSVTIPVTFEITRVEGGV